MKQKSVITIIIAAFLSLGITAPGFSDDTVVFVPGYIKGTINLGGIAVSQAQISAPCEGMSCSTTAKNGNYELTVQVPENGSKAFIVTGNVYTDNAKDLIDFRSASVTVSDGETVPLNININPGFISGQVSVSGCSLGGGTLYASLNTDGNYTSARTSIGSDGNFSFPVQPNSNIKVYGYINTAGGSYNLENKFVNLTAGNTATVNWNIQCEVKEPGSVSGDFYLHGLELTGNTLDRHMMFSGRSVSIEKNGPYALTNLDPGNHTFTAISYLNKGDDSFTHPNANYSRTLTVVSGENAINNVSTHAAFANGKITLSGTKNIQDVRIATISASGISQTPSYGGSSTDKVDVSNGDYDLVLSEGGWNIYHTYLTFMENTPENYLNSSLDIYDYMGEHNISLDKGEVVKHNIEYETGTVTVRFKVKGGAALSSPRLLGDYIKRNESRQAELQARISAAGLPTETTLGKVTYIGIPGTYNLTASAYVNGSHVPFGKLNVGVIAGKEIIVDIDETGTVVIVDDGGDDDEKPPFEAGAFTVGSAGVVQFDWLYDGGMYQGELGIFSLKGMENLTPGSAEFIAEAVRRVRSGSVDGHLVLSDPTERARFSGSLGEPKDWNSGEYRNVRSFEMRQGDSFATILVPNSTFAALAADPGTADSHRRPLFSLVSPNPAYGMYLGQIADVNGMGTAFSYEDMSADTSDRDYNDLIIQIFGATVQDIPSIDSLKGRAARAKRDSSDWRTETELGRTIMEHLDAQAISSETVWLSADINFPADMTVYAPDGEAFGTTGGHIPGATVGADIDGYRFVKLPSLETGEYRIVLRSADEQSGLLTLRKHQGTDGILSETGGTVTLEAHGTVRADVSVSGTGDESGVEIGNAAEGVRYDFNGDDVTDDKDIEIISALWNTCKGDEKFDPFFDLDDDGCITVLDIMRVGN